MEEISLRECIQVLINQKRIIAVFIIIPVLLSAIFSFFVIAPVYQPKTVLMTSNVNWNRSSQKLILTTPEQENTQTTSPTEGIEGLLDELSKYPQMSIDTFKEQINNPQVLDGTIAELKLNDKGIQRSDLRDMISINTIKGTNLITIEVTYTDKKLATDIANTITRKFIDFISANTKAQMEKTTEYIKQQMDVEKKNLDQVLAEYESYISKPRSLNELQKEVDSKLALITQYKSDLLNSKIEEQKIRASLSAANQLIGKTPEKIKTTQVQAGTQVEAEEINNAYIELKSNINTLNIDLAKTVAQEGSLQTEIDGLQKDLEALQVELGERQHEDKQIQDKVNFAQQAYKLFSDKYEEMRITQSYAIGETNIIVVSPAVEPVKPVAPNKKLNIAIAGVLGLMLGIFVAFFIEYWKNTGDTNKKSQSLIQA